MEKEFLKQMFKENLLFHLFKDKNEFSTKNSRERLKLIFCDVNVSHIHNRIINYQIKKYGQNVVKFKEIGNKIKC